VDLDTDWIIGIALLSIIALVLILVSLLFAFLPTGGSIFVWWSLPLGGLIVGGTVLWLLTRD
jgi:hypothetical protein